MVDDLEPAFVQAILRARPELQAIEMEAAGAAFAIELARDEGSVRWILDGAWSLGHARSGQWWRGRGRRGRHETARQLEAVRVCDRSTLHRELGRVAMVAVGTPPMNPFLTLCHQATSRSDNALK
ncbi:MAG TPA: hypothetical protein VM580_31115, partial [Labilithrix sp.]|nr:hypothetical protein [Labilithrix sp.]